MPAELYASGSPRKRFDKAVKADPWAIVAYSLRNGEAARRIKADVPVQGVVEAALA
jgi:histidyl-tRNA synthetase